MEGLPLDPRTNVHTGQIGGRGTPTKNGFLWVADGPDASSSGAMGSRLSSTAWANRASDEYAIEQAIMRTISIRTTNLPTVRDHKDMKPRVSPHRHADRTKITSKECRSWFVEYGISTTQQHRPHLKSHKRDTWTTSDLNAGASRTSGTTRTRCGIGPL